MQRREQSCHWRLQSLRAIAIMRSTFRVHSSTSAFPAHFVLTQIRATMQPPPRRQIRANAGISRSQRSVPGNEAEVEHLHRMVRITLSTTLRFFLLSMVGVDHKTIAINMYSCKYNRARAKFLPQVCGWSQCRHQWSFL
mmetsp:Transcript_113183/g.225374  ORF Transcript_113183/g.225374 Transcript_113183/m.225374 type:complete len:139 (+) Transcript_113183:871-1287(+)